MKFIENFALRKIQAAVEDGQLDIKHLKIYKGENIEVYNEEETYSEMIQKYFKQMIGDDEWDGFRVPFFNQPTVIDCLGVKPQSPAVEILEGFVRMSYDMVVRPANEECLFPAKK